jgi:preprotein translocase subunit SecD
MAMMRAAIAVGAVVLCLAAEGAAGGSAVATGHGRDMGAVGATAPAVVEFAFEKREISSVERDSAGHLRVKLRPLAADRFEAFTRRHLGMSVVITVGGRKLVHAVVRAPIASGSIIVKVDDETHAAEILRFLGNE